MRKTMNKLVSVGVVLAVAHRDRARDSGDSRRLRAAQRHPARLSGGRSGGKEQVESRKDPRRQMVSEI